MCCFPTGGITSGTQASERARSVWPGVVVGRESTLSTSRTRVGGKQACALPESRSGLLSVRVVVMPSTAVVCPLNAATSGGVESAASLSQAISAVSNALRTTRHQAAETLSAMLTRHGKRSAGSGSNATTHTNSQCQNRRINGSGTHPNSVLVLNSIFR